MPWTTVGNIRGPQGPQGPAGAAGEAGPAGPVGPAGLTWRGAWSAANSYAINDSVGWGGSTYFATAAKAAGAAPPTGTAADPGADDAALNVGWALLAVQGQTGPQGPQGNPGEQGIPGTPGSPGATGTRGSQTFTSMGAPGTVAGAIPGDAYIDMSTGDYYKLT